MYVADKLRLCKCISRGRGQQRYILPTVTDASQPYDSGAAAASSSDSATHLFSPTVQDLSQFFKLVAYMSVGWVSHLVSTLVLRF